MTLHIPYASAGILDVLNREAAVLRIDYTDEDILLEAVVPPELFCRVKAFIPGWEPPREEF